LGDAGGDFRITHRGQPLAVELLHGGKKIALPRAVDALRAAGVANRDILVMSSEPFEEYEFSHRDKATWLHWIAGAGGASGFTVGYFLTSITEQLWPIKTSGMPIVAGWPNAVVIFELTMLGAILATVITLFITAKLPNRGPRLYDPEVSDAEYDRLMRELLARSQGPEPLAGSGRRTLRSMVSCARNCRALASGRCWRPPAGGCAAHWQPMSPLAARAPPRN